MATLTSNLIVRLLDKVTGPARQVGKALNGITDAARRAGRSGDMLGNLQNAIERNNRALDRARGRLVDAAAGFGILAVAIGAPIKAAVEFEAILEDIGQKLNMPQAQFADFGKRIRQIAKDVTQSSASVAGGIDVLAGMGANENDAMAMMPSIGKAATAYRAEIEHLASAGYAALDNLKVPAEQFGQALDSMAQAGKAGAFELRDMAQYFPQLTTAYQGLGQQGVPAVADLAAALQITRKGAGDASSAATNLSNILQKINAPLTRKAFAKMGVNLEAELKKSAQAGLTPIEAIAEITKRTLKGDLSKLGDLFQDAQVQQGLRPLIQNIELYRQIRKEAMAAQGVVEADYARRLETARGALMRLSVALESIKLAIGSALLPALADLAAKFAPIAEMVVDFAEANPRLTRSVVALAAGLIGLRVALIGLQYAALLAKGGLLSMLVPFVRVGKAARAAAGANIAYQATLAGMGGGKLSGLGKIAAGLRGIVMAVPGITLLGSAFSAVGAIIGAVTLPMLGIAAAVVAAVAVVGLVIYKYWEPLKAFFSGFFSGFQSAIAPISQAISKAFSPIINTIGPIVGPILSSLVEWFKELLIPISAADELTHSWGDAGRNAGEMVAKAFNMATAPLRFIITLLGEAVALYGKFQIGALKGVGNVASRVSSWWNDSPAKPARPDKQGPGGTPRVAGARARGGPVTSGRTYLVGEQGPELWKAPQSGSIIPSRETMAALRSGMEGRAPLPSPAAATTPALNINISNHFNGVTDRDEMLREFGASLEREAAKAIRGLHTNTGLR